MKFSDKEISLFRGISLISAVFTLVIAFTMLFTLVQLKTLNPLDNPALLSIQEQYERDPDNQDKVEYVRAMDLMARKAYFSSRWQVEAGSYLLLAGAAIFVIFQRLIAGSEKPKRYPAAERPDIISDRKKYPRYLLISAGSVTMLAILSSFVLRAILPSPGRSVSASEGMGSRAEAMELAQPDNVNFPFFRGEGSRGISAGNGFVTEWNVDDGTNIKWKSSVPRHGKNSPVIWGNYVYLTGAENNVCEVYCFDKITGEILWTGSGSEFQGASDVVPESDMEAGMAGPTVAAWEGGVCAIFGNANLVCFDHDGKLKWAKNLGVPQTIYGFTSSLLIYKDILLIQYDSDEKLAVIGIDVNTGEQKWETARQGRTVNSSPILASIDGQPQMLINGNPNVTAFDPETGTELWTLPGVSGDVAASLAVNSNFVYTASDYFKVKALKPGKSGSTIWEDNTFTPDASSPVANEKYLFVATGNGDVACYDAQKGEVLWENYFENSFYASPVICDGKVWIIDRGGIMHVIEAEGVLNIISSTSVGESTDSTPAFSEGRIYIRGMSSLICIAAN